MALLQVLELGLGLNKGSLGLSWACCRAGWTGWVLLPCLGLPGEDEAEEVCWRGRAQRDALGSENPSALAQAGRGWAGWAAQGPVLALQRAQQMPWAWLCPPRAVPESISHLAAAGDLARSVSRITPGNDKSRQQSSSKAGITAG